MHNSQKSTLEQAETDRLLAQINQQLLAGNFESNDSQQLQRLVAALADQRGIVRFGFVEAFGKIGKPMVPFLLESLANDPNPVVRRSCGKALAKIADSQAIPVLIETLQRSKQSPRLLSVGCSVKAFKPR
ncbi:MAG: HEAT repeat domain-containing protein [Symploca sp. SIO3C6]|nr:HEAT repeat domain-containing protein [Symploca sp. SIO3C6]